MGKRSRVGQTPSPLLRLLWRARVSLASTVRRVAIHEPCQSVRRESTGPLSLTARTPVQSAWMSSAATPRRPPRQPSETRCRLAEGSWAIWLTTGSTSLCGSGRIRTNSFILLSRGSPNIVQRNVVPSFTTTSPSPTGPLMLTAQMRKCPRHSLPGCPDVAGLDVGLDAGDDLPGADDRFAKRADRAALAGDGVAIG